MFTIWKYPLTPGMCDVEMPIDSQVLSVHAQGESICVWVMVECDKIDGDREIKTFYSVGTGGESELPPHVFNMHFIGTVLLLNGFLVYHVFDVTSRAPLQDGRKYCDECDGFGCDINTNKSCPKCSRSGLIKKEPE